MSIPRDALQNVMRERRRARPNQRAGRHSRLAPRLGK
jgi:hypothetical protein